MHSDGFKTLLDELKRTDPVPDDRYCICMTPNIPRTKSRGRLWLLSRNPDIKPAIDFGYFTDPDGYDEQTIVDGLEIAREVAATGPFKDWIKREIAPGPAIVPPLMRTR